MLPQSIFLQIIDNYFKKKERTFLVKKFHFEFARKYFSNEELVNLDSIFLYNFFLRTTVH